MKKARLHLSGGVLMMLTLFASGNICAGPAGGVEAGKPASAAQQGFFAKVGDVIISYEEYNAAFNTAARNKFYHGTPPQNEVAGLQREVADQLVAKVLLVKEAKRRGLRPDAEEIQKGLQAYEQRYATNEQWKQNREAIIASLKTRLEENNLFDQLERSVRNVSAPTKEEVKKYYAMNLDKFTEPEKVRVSLILKRVDPSSPTAAWEKAKEEVGQLVQKLESGADFATLAREHSSDPSGKEAGGDLGFLHKGMLPEGTEAILDTLKVGETSKPIHLLEGIAVLRVTDRMVAKLNDFERVEKRAGELLQRDKSEQAWSNLIADLKKKTPAQIDQSQFLPLIDQPGPKQAVK